MKKFWLVFIILTLLLVGGVYLYLQSITQKSEINEIRPGSPLKMTTRVSPLPRVSPSASSRVQYLGPPDRDY